MVVFSSILLLISSCAVTIHARHHGNEVSQHPITRSQTPLRPPGRPTPIHGNSSSIPHPTGAASCEPYWMEQIKHQGVASFNPDSTYQVFRNVKNYGAVGDGLTDDTVAIQRAISDGGRCAPGVCQSSTTTPAVVYFPSGTYLISASIIDYYYTQVCFLYTVIYISCIDNHRSSEIRTACPLF